MNFDWLVLVFIGIFLLLFGVFSVTNLHVEWGKQIMGFSALLAGIICIVRACR